MSQKKIFRCQDCGYETEVYEGRGFMGQHIEAMSCPDCRNIVPLVVGGVIGDAAPSFNSLVGRLCLRCGSDRIHRWDMHTCPKCGARCNPLAKKSFGHENCIARIIILNIRKKLRRIDICISLQLLSCT